MTQFARPTPAAADYDSTIIGALELVSFPEFKRRTRHVLGASGEELAFDRTAKGPLRRGGPSGRAAARRTTGLLDGSNPK